MDRRPVIVGIVAAIVVSGGALWLVASGRAGFRPVEVEDVREPQAVPPPRLLPLSDAPISSTPFTETVPRESRSPRAEADPDARWTPKEKDKSYALFLSRMAGREFFDVLALVDTREKAERLKTGVEAMKKKRQAGSSSSHELMSELVAARHKAGDYETLDEREYSKRFGSRRDYTKVEELTWCASGIDPETKQPRFKIFSFRRGQDPRIDAAIDERNGVYRTVREDAEALIAELSR